MAIAMDIVNYAIAMLLLVCIAIIIYRFAKKKPTLEAERRELERKKQEIIDDVQRQPVRERTLVDTKQQSVVEGVNDLFVKELVQICYNYQFSDTRHGQHDSLLNMLSNFYRDRGFVITREYPIRFDSYFLRENKIETSNGLIDLVLDSDSQKIAIEFDSGVTLKYKSIAKLIQSNADVRVGIVKGRKSYSVYETKYKMKDVVRRVSYLPKDFWLISINQRVAEKINLNDFSTLKLQNLDKPKSYSIDDIRLTYPKAYAKWSEQEDSELKEKYLDGMTVKELAIHFKRKEGAIYARLKKLGLEWD